MDPFAQPIKTLVIENDFAFTDFEDESHQDLILEASKVSIDQAWVNQYVNFLAGIAAENYSRVLVTPTDFLSLFPEECIVVPTLGEAQDLIEMERIERDLGF